MKKWEYEIIYIAFQNDERETKKEKTVRDTLTKYGNNGWELVQMDNLLHDSCIDGNMIFKRLK